MVIPIFNEDISEEIWKHIPFSSMKKTSIVSKQNAKYYKTISYPDFINAMYLESTTLVNFTNDIIKIESEKYGYRKNYRFYFKFIKVLDLVFHINAKYVNSYIKSNNFIIFYNIICIIVHCLNRNYKKLIELFKEIRYNNLFLKKEEYVSILKLSIDIITEDNFKKIFGNYSENTIQLVKICYFTHTYMIASIKTDATITKDYSNVYYIKKKELLLYLKNYLSICKYPKYFLINLQNIAIKIKVPRHV